MSSHYNSKKVKYFNPFKSFKFALSIPLFLNQIFQFLERDDIKFLSLC